MVNILLSILMLSFLVGTPLYAETYSWIDDNGTVNFTENRGDVPRKYRKKVKQLDGVSSEAPIIKPVLPKSPPHIQSKKDNLAEADSTTRYSGKTYDQWKQELSEREASMSDTRKKIDVMDAQIKKNGTTPAMVQERNRMVETYNGLVAEYDKTVEAIRKAGLKVDIK